MQIADDIPQFMLELLRYINRLWNEKSQFISFISYKLSNTIDVAILYIYNVCAFYLLLVANIFFMDQM